MLEFEDERLEEQEKDVPTQFLQTQKISLTCMNTWINVATCY